VKQILALARAQIVTSLRERVSLFWFLIFPVFLFIVLNLIFSNIGQQGQMNFSVALINEDTAAAGAPVDFAGIVAGVFEKAAAQPEGGGQPLFDLTAPEQGESTNAFVAREREAVRLGRLSALIVIPSGFNQSVLARLSNPNAPQAGITVYQNHGNTGSEMAAAIIGQMVSGVDRELLTRAGQFSQDKAVPIKTGWAGGSAGQVSYTDFLLPGVILMGFFVTGLFGVPGSILFARDQRILRGYWVTPVTVPRYLAGFSLGQLALCLIQFFVLFLLGWLAFGASVQFARPLPAFYLLLSAVTFLAFGFLISSIAKTADAGMALANVLNIPMMFLGGLFFPTGGLPLALRVIVWINPITYLAEGLRTGLGVQTGTLPTPLTIAVPVAWIGACTLVATRRLRWDVAK
jgi:ABC-2 type transport system permease protein